MGRVAEAFGVDEPAVKVLCELTEHHLVLFRLDLMRHSHLADAAEISIREKGFIATPNAIAAFRGELAARCEAFRKLPADTLGYAFYRRCWDHGFALSGRKARPPRHLSRLHPRTLRLGDGPRGGDPGRRTHRRLE